jgi:hypothetical protein
MRSDGTETDACTLSASIYIFIVNNAVNRSVNESSILIGRISKQESNQKLAKLSTGYLSSTL